MAEQFRGVFPDEMMNDLPLIAFPGNIHVIDDSGKVKSACDFLRQQPVMGFDTETRPSFKKGRINKVSLLQLAVSDHAFLFRLNYIGLPQEIISILSDKNILKIGLAVRDDLNHLKKLASFDPESFIDLQKVAGEFGIEEKSLKKLAAIVLGKRIKKGQQTSNWESPQLTEAQRIYAATDAWVCYEIYKVLQSCRR